MNQHGEFADPASGPSAAWGPMRVVYLQYASDPATFFDYRSLYREPDWMRPPRGPIAIMIVAAFNVFSRDRGIVIPVEAP